LNGGVRDILAVGRGQKNWAGIKAEKMVKTRDRRGGNGVRGGKTVRTIERKWW